MGSFARLLEMVSVWLTLLLPLPYAFLAVWGTLLWFSMDETWYLTYRADFWPLLLLFKMYVVMAYIGIVVNLCLAAVLNAKSLRDAFGGQGSAAAESSPLLPKNETHYV